MPEYITREVNYNHNLKIATLSTKEYYQAVKMQFANQLPTFNLSGISLFNASDAGKLFNIINAFNAVGGLVNLDLFKGGAKVANLKLKKASYEKALEQYRQTNLTSVQEINDSLVYLKKDGEKLEEKDNGYFNKRYEKGIISKLDLLQSEENLLTIRQRVVNEQIACYIDYISLYKATGAKL